MALADTPKPGSEAFQLLLSRVRAMFAGSALGLLADGVLDRGQLEKVVGRLNNVARHSLKQMQRTELAAHVVLASNRSDEGAYGVFKELDGATRTQRNLVASVPGPDAKSRLLGHRALLLHRHGAKLLWAVARDERPALWPVGAEMAQRFVDNAQRIDRLRLAATADGALAEFHGFERGVEDLGARLYDLERAASQAEQERARLLLEVGKREARVRQERAQRQELEQRISTLEAAARRLAEAPTAQERVAENADDASSKVQQLRQRLHAAEAELAQERQRTSDLQHQNEALRERMNGLREELASLRAAAPAKSIAARPANMQEDHSSRALVESPKEHRARRGFQEEGGARLGVFLDVANLAGAARRLYAGSIDYGALLARLANGRRLVEARAYVIDNGSNGFEGFVAALRAVGFQVTAKQPKVFPDGSRKADWDVAISVDALSKRQKFDVIVLGSGDGDFLPLVRALRAASVFVEVASFIERSNGELVNTADRHLPLEAGILI